MMHVEEIIIKVIEAIKKQSEVLGPCHGLVYGPWGVGKTYSAKKIASESKGVFYMKAPADDVSRSKFIKQISHAIGAGLAHTVEETLDLMKEHISILGFKPILLLDESQRVFKRVNLLDVLKDIAEEEGIELCYVFLADNSAPRIISSVPHSIHKRIIIRVELAPVTEKTVRKLVGEVANGLNWEILHKIARERGWTVLDLTMVVSTLKRANMEGTEENIIKIASSLGR